MNPTLLTIDLTNWLLPNSWDKAELDKCQDSEYVKKNYPFDECIKFIKTVKKVVENNPNNKKNVDFIQLINITDTSENSGIQNYMEQIRGNISDILNTIGSGYSQIKRIIHVSAFQDIVPNIFGVTENPKINNGALFQADIFEAGNVSAADINFEWWYQDNKCKQSGMCTADYVSMRNKPNYLFGDQIQRHGTPSKTMLNEVVEVIFIVDYTMIIPLASSLCDEIFSAMDIEE